MWNIGKMVLLMLALGALTQPSWSADDLMASQWVDPAREWQQKDRDDLAADLWRKLLRANPKHPEALVKLGVIKARAGNLKEAEELHKRAAELAKPPAGLNQLSLAVGAAEGRPAHLLPALAKPEPSKPAPPKSVETAAKTTPDKRVAPEVDAPSRVSSEQKTQTPAASTPPKADVSEKPAYKAEADTLNLKFSNSMDWIR